MSSNLLENGLVLSDDRTKVISYTQKAGVLSVDIPDSVVSLPPALFSGSSMLKKIKLPRNVRVIPAHFFENCTSLEKIIMPAVVDAFGQSAFSGCYSLSSIPFRAGLVELPQDVFSYCTSLTSLVIPNTVKIIKSGAVSDCTSLTAVVLPSQLETLEAGAFAGCSSLRHIRISDENDFFRVDESDGCLYKKQSDGTETLVLKPVDFERHVAKIIKVSEFDNEFEDDEEYFDEDDIEVGVLGEETAAIETGVIEEVIVQEKAVDENLAAPQNDVSEKSDTVVASQYDEDDFSSIYIGDSDDFIDVDSGREVAVMQNEIHTSNEPFQEFVPVDQSEVDNLFASKENDDIAEKTASIVSANARTVDEQFTPVLQDELALLATESDILSQNTATDITVDITTAESVDAALTGDKLLARIAAAAEQYDCIALAGASDRVEWNASLYVFAENLVFNDEGTGMFSQPLVNCCRRIARIHGYTRIFLYYGVPLDDEEFVQLFTDFIEGRSIIYACSASNTTELSDNARRFADIAGISLEKETLALSNDVASNANEKIIKMILQDEYSS